MKVILEPFVEVGLHLLDFVLEIRSFRCFVCCENKKYLGGVDGNKETPVKLFTELLAALLQKCYQFSGGQMFDTFQIHNPTVPKPSSRLMSKAWNTVSSAWVKLLYINWERKCRRMVGYPFSMT